MINVSKKINVALQMKKSSIFQHILWIVKRLFRSIDYIQFELANEPKLKHQ